MNSQQSQQNGNNRFDKQFQDKNESLRVKRLRSKALKAEHASSRHQVRQQLQKIRNGQYDFDEDED